MRSSLPPLSPLPCPSVSPRTVGILDTFRPRHAGSRRSRPPWPPGSWPTGARSTSSGWATRPTWRMRWCSRRWEAPTRIRGRHRRAQPGRRRHRPARVRVLRRRRRRRQSSTSSRPWSCRSIVVAHTVVRAPSANQRSILERVCEAADAVVVMTESARSRLISGFDVDPSKISTIPHGAATPPAPPPPRRATGSRRPRLLTWGLLGPGKGIEWAIDAVAASGGPAAAARVRRSPAHTHPKVLARRARRTGTCSSRSAARPACAALVSFDGPTVTSLALGPS